jgi:hypothetical protein
LSGVIEQPHFGQTVLRAALTFSRLIFCFLGKREIVSRSKVQGPRKFTGHESLFGGRHGLNWLLGNVQAFVATAATVAGIGVKKFNALVSEHYVAAN